jgi:hypothetical protein
MKRFDPLVKRKISLPNSLCARVDEYLLDPSTGKRAYGELSRLIERLLREHLAGETKNVSFDDLLEEKPTPNNPLDPS